MRPIDMQTVLPRVQEIPAAKQVLINKGDNALAHAQMSDHMKREIEHTRIQTSEEASLNALRRDGEEAPSHSDAREEGSKRRKDKDATASIAQDPIMGTRFDMKV